MVEAFANNRLIDPYEFSDVIFGDLSVSYGAGGAHQTIQVGATT
jgi:hypothetical protein